MTQTSSKTFTRERDAKYAAKQAGLTLEQIVTFQNGEGRWGYQLKDETKLFARKAAPEGKRAVVIALASRPEGATRAELIEATGWKAAPWKWLFSNPQHTGICDRYNLPFRCEEIGRTSRYFVGGAAA